MGGISLITIYDRKFRHNRPEEGLPKMITYISPINMVAEDNHLYFAYKSPFGLQPSEINSLHGLEISSISQVPLGIIITTDLKSSAQCIAVEKKAQRILGYVKHVFCYLNKRAGRAL